MNLIQDTLVHRFRSQVTQHPDRLAVAAADRRLTYAELAGAVNAMSNALLGRSPPSLQRVVLLVDQGISAVVATLGTLGASAAYVPLDPMLPVGQLADLVGHADPSLIVASRRYLELARSLLGDRSRVLCIEEIEVDGDVSEPALAVAPDSLAYIYYTSGSTGKPKGVCDNHRNVLHNIWRYTTNLRIGIDDRLTLLQAPHFSGAVSSMFCALLNGAACFPFDVRRDGLEPIGVWLRTNRITMFHSVPAIFREVITGGDFPALRCVRLEGDRASSRDIELFRRHCPADSLLANGLGATECGLVRQWRVDASTVIPEGPMPIGDAIPGMDLLLVNDDRQEVSVGAVGEIAVRSRYLALGYWRQPDLTATRFLADGSDPTLRTYLTGDLGRMLPGGLLQYLGRKDLVSKIRGQWVDVDTVERALLSIPGVREAVVSIRDEVDREPRLVAYVVAESGTELVVRVLRQQAGARLPLAMVPAAWVVLPSLPLNANLKVDRAALPASAFATGTNPTAYVAPQSPLQQQLVEIWGEVLGMDRIGILDDLFDLGADSLSISRIQIRVASTFSVEVTISFLFERPSIAELADAIGKGSDKASDRCWKHD